MSLYSPTNSFIEKLRKLFKTRVKDGRIAYLGDGAGRCEVPDRRGYYYYRFEIGGTVSIARSGNASFPVYDGAEIYIAIGYNDEPEIVGTNYARLDQTGFDTRIFNQMHQQSKFVYLWDIAIAWTMATATRSTNSYLVSIKKHLTYINNILAYFETGEEADKLDLEPYKPAIADQHRYAIVWQDTYHQIGEVTTSTAQSLFMPLDITDANEAVVMRPPDAIIYKAFVLTNPGNTLRQSVTEIDTRQFLNTPVPWGFPNPVTYRERIQPDRQQLFTGSLVVTGSLEVLGSLVGIDSSGEENTSTDTGITQLTGDVTAGPGSGSQVATLANTGVSAGVHPYPASITLDAKGRATSITDGTAPLTSPLTTKGDLWGFSTVNARVPVGTNNQVLVSDSAQALGVKYSSVAALTDIVDSSGNEISKFVGVASAVNEITTTNAAAGSNPKIEVTGSDTNRGVDILPKGTGAVNIDGAVVINESGADRDTRIEGDTNANLFVVDASADAVGIGTNTPSNKTILDVVSTTRAARPVPSQTTAQRVALSSPATGSKVYDTDLGMEMSYNGSTWVGSGFFPRGFGVYLSGLTVSNNNPHRDIAASLYAYIYVVNGTTLALWNGSIWEPHWFLGAMIFTNVTDAYATTASTSNGSAVLTNLDPITVNYICAGMTVTGTGIPGGTTILSVDSATQITLSANASATATGVSLTIKMAADTNYDVFLRWSNAVGNVAYCVTAWTNATTRAIDLDFKDEIYVQDGDAKKCYIGTLRTDASGLITNTVLKRHIWSLYNPYPRALRVTDNTNNWNYTTAAWRQANGSTANQVEVLVGLDDYSLIELETLAYSSSSSAASYTGIGEDSTSTLATGVFGGQVAGSINLRFEGHARLKKNVPLGAHTYTWLEYGGTGVQFQGDSGTTLMLAGMDGKITC